MLYNGQYIYIPANSDGTSIPAPRISQGYDEARNRAMLDCYWASALGEIAWGPTPKQALSRLQYLINGAISR